jgi:hypothetical protein
VTSLILAVVLLIVAILLPRFIPASAEGARGDHAGPPPAMFRLPILAGRIVLALVVLYLVASTSIIQIPADRVGVVTKIYGAFALPEGHIIRQREKPEFRPNQSRPERSRFHRSSTSSTT